LSHEHSQPLCMKMVPNVRQPPAIRRLGLNQTFGTKLLRIRGNAGETANGRTSNDGSAV
jgi:hypothetical protein